MRVRLDSCMKIRLVCMCALEVYTYFRYKDLKASKDTGKQAKINSLIHATVPTDGGYKAKINTAIKDVMKALRYASKGYKDQHSMGMTRTEIVAHLHGEAALLSGIACGDVLEDIDDDGRPMFFLRRLKRGKVEEVEKSFKKGSEHK